MSEPSADAAAPTPATDAAPAAPRRRRRWLKWTAGVVLVLGALVAAAPALISSSWMNDVIRSWLKENVDRPVEFASLDVGWGTGVELQGLVVHDSKPGRPPLLEAPRVVLRAPVLPMLLRRFDVQEFVIDDAVVHLAQRGDGTNAEGVVKQKKSGGGKDDDEETPLVLPDIRVPVTVRNLTLVFEDEQGHEIRRGGIAFTGRLMTREGPCTFDLNVPTSGAGSLKVKGTATLFSPDGAMLRRDRVQGDVDVDVTGVDAETNADVLKLFLPDHRVRGILDAKLRAHNEGSKRTGSIDLRVHDRTATAGDLTVTGTFESSGTWLALHDLKVRGDGLTLDADGAGEWPSLEGRATLDVDLAGAAGWLKAFVEEEAEGEDGEKDMTYAGSLKGEFQFLPSPAGAQGTLTLTGFRATTVDGSQPPVTIDRADVSFRGAPTGQAFRLDALDVRLADLSAHVSGSIASDFTLDLASEAKGDLGGLLARAADLGVVPEGFAINGTLDAAVAVRGRADGKGADALAVQVDHILLSEDDVRIEVRGSASRDGRADLKASGAGDLGKLLGRARPAGADSESLRLDAVRGRFEFEADAEGDGVSQVVNLRKLTIDGDLRVEASGRYDVSGGIVDGQAAARGEVDDLLALARRLGFLEDRPARLGGTLDASLQVAGFTSDLQLPNVTLRVQSPALRVDGRGSKGVNGDFEGSLKADGDVARLTEFATAAGFTKAVPEEHLPALRALRGRLLVDVVGMGAENELKVGRVSVSVRDAPAAVDVVVSQTPEGPIEGTASIEGALADLCAFARETGKLDRDLAPAGRMRASAVIAGTREAPKVPSFDLRVTGPVTVEALGTRDDAGRLDVTADVAGSVQALLDLGAQWTGEAARKLDGKFAAKLAARGAPDALDAEVPSLSVSTKSLTLDATASRRATGEVAAHGTAKGAVADLVDLVRAFGVAADVQASGVLDAKFDVTSAVPATPPAEGATGIVAQGLLEAVVTDLVLTSPEVGSGGPFREPRAALSVPAFRFDLDSQAFDAEQVLAEMKGLRLEAKVGARTGPPARDFSTTRVVDAQGRFTAGAEFVRNHPELFDEISFQSVEVPFTFAGEVTGGLASAGGWTGNGTLSMTSVVAPHLNVARAKADWKLEGGAAVVDPIDAVANGGPVTGKARIELARADGKPPEHSLELHAKDVAIESDLAPLLARASPLFAVGEHGKSGGAAAVDLNLRARGLDLDAVRRSLDGGGKVALKDAFVESGDWVGTLLSLAGASGRMNLSPVDVPFTVKDGSVTTGDVAMQGAGLLLRLAGQVGLDGKLDYGLRMKPTGASSAFEKYASLLDAEGFLPLRLAGNLTKPRLRAPKLKDALKSKVGDLLGGLLGKDDKDDEPPPEEKKAGGRRKREPKQGEDPPPEGSGDEPPPPPPPLPPREK